MKFYESAKCVSCERVWVFDTPIPDILIWRSPCIYCGATDLAGIVAEPEDGDDLDSDDEKLEELPY